MNKNSPLSSLSDTLFLWTMMGRLSTKRLLLFFATTNIFLLLCLPLPTRAQLSQEDLCRNLATCLETLLGQPVQIPNELSENAFCDALIRVYQGSYGIDSLCAAVASTATTGAANVQQQAATQQQQQATATNKHKKQPAEMFTTNSLESSTGSKKKKNTMMMMTMKMKKTRKKTTKTPADKTTRTTVTNRINDMASMETTTANTFQQKSRLDFNFSSERDGGHRNLAAPLCELPFDPTYADESGANTVYDTYMLTIEDIYLLDGKLERSDTDTYAALKIGWGVALTAAAEAAGVPGTEIVTQQALAALEITIDQVDTHDHDINSVEIEAAFENSQTILTQTCNLIDQLDTVERNMMTRFDAVDRTVKVLETRFDRVEKTLHRLEMSLDRVENLLTRVLYPHKGKGGNYKGPSYWYSSKSKKKSRKNKSAQYPYHYYGGKMW